MLRHRQAFLPFAPLRSQHKLCSSFRTMHEAHPGRGDKCLSTSICTLVPAALQPSDPSGREATASAVVLQRIQEQFDGRAAAYDQDNTYHPPLAQHLLSLSELQPGQRLLDLASGTGLVALPAAAAVGPSGFVAAVDISQAMLDQAQSKYTASLQQQQQQPDSTQCQQTLAPMQFIQGDVEELESCLPGEWKGSFDAITCSAAVPFLQDASAAFQQWRSWLQKDSGRLVLNAFVAPAVEDFGTFVELAKQHGLPHEKDPCETLGTVERVTSVLQHAGYQRIKVLPEPKERWYPAPSLETYAEKMWQMAVSSNPFSDPERLQQLGDKQQAFHEAFLSAVVEHIRREGRHDAAAGRVLSRYTVLHVLARVS